MCPILSLHLRHSQKADRILAKHNSHIYLRNNDGAAFVVRAGREFELRGNNSLGETITATPAVSGRSLIDRTDSHLYRLGDE